MPHDYAACQIELCDLCDAYNAGYGHGKDKAHFEVRTHILDDHDDRCACEVCKTVRAVLLRLNTVTMQTLRSDYARFQSGRRLR